MPGASCSRSARTASSRGRRGAGRAEGDVGGAGRHARRDRRVRRRQRARHRVDGHGHVARRDRARYRRCHRAHRRRARLLAGARWQRRLEVSTAAGVMLRARDAGARAVSRSPLPVLGELLAKRGDRRLVRATPPTAALLDRAACARTCRSRELGAVLGDDAMLAASWLGSHGRDRAPAAHPAAVSRARCASHATPDPVIACPPSCAILPAAGELARRAIAQPGAAMHAVAAIALAGERRSTPRRSSRSRRSTAVRRRAVRSRRARVAMAARATAAAPARRSRSRSRASVVACAARGEQRQACARRRDDGAPRWEWRGDTVDGVIAAGDVVARHRCRSPDRRSTRATATSLGELASDDGGAMRVPRSSMSPG